MINVAVIGCGFMGGMHAACYQALAPLGVKVAVTCDVYEAPAKALAEKYGAVPCTDLNAVLENKDIDVVDICLPTHKHVCTAVAAMKAGKDVFVEKPICIDEDEMELILKTEAETGRKVQVGQVIRFWNEYVWLKKTAEAGTYGRVLNGHFHRLSSRPEWATDGWLHKPELSGGLAVDMHVHDVDFVRYLFGEPDRVNAQAGRDANGLIQQIYAVYGYGKDVAVSVEAGWDYPPTYPFTAGFRVKFEKASVINDVNGLTVYPQEGEPFHPEMDAGFQGDNDIGGNISDLGGYYNELKFFVEGLKGEHALDVATVAEAIKSVKLVKKEIEAAGGLIVK
ncbi:MAG: Gfo/Idh/MocA family oxidoreductase [Clostridia bacterium]|nr:Gfo/Idh/MocA family oxidoreductase [Clostridia bacterium]